MGSLTIAHMKTKKMIAQFDPLMKSKSVLESVRWRGSGYLPFIGYQPFLSPPRLVHPVHPPSSRPSQSQSNHIQPISTKNSAGCHSTEFDQIRPNSTSFLSPPLIP